MGQNSIQASGNINIEGTQQPIPLATALPGDNRQNGVDVYLYAPSGNAAIVRLTDGTTTVGIAIPAGGSVSLTDHIVSDTALYALGTNGDDLEWTVIASPNPSV